MTASGQNGIECAGTLLTSFQLMGSLHFSMELEGYPDQGETNAFLEAMKGRKIIVTVEGVQP